MHYPQRLKISGWMVTGALRLMERAATAGPGTTSAGPAGDERFEYTLRMVGTALQVPRGA